MTKPRFCDTLFCSCLQYLPTSESRPNGRAINEAVYGIGRRRLSSALMDWMRGGSDPIYMSVVTVYWILELETSCFSPTFQILPSSERQAMSYMRGRVIDMGSAAGRVSLYLQKRGVESHVRQSRSRQGSAVWVGLVRRGAPRAKTHRESSARSTLWCSSGTTLVFSGPLNDFDMCSPVVSADGSGSPDSGREHQSLLWWGSRPRSESVPRNKEQGLMPGQCRLRVRSRGLTTPWFHWLLVSRQEMRLLVRGTGWRLSRTLGTAPREAFVGILEKD